MSNIPATPRQGSESPPITHRGAQPSASAARWRPRMKTILAPLILAVLGLALLVWAYTLYPRGTALSTPPNSSLEIDTTFSIGFVGYGTRQESSTTAAMFVTVSLPSGLTRPPAGKATAHLSVEPPSQITFWHCLPPHCTRPLGKPIRGILTEALAFNSAGEADFWFFVKHGNFGAAYNGVTAAAAIPAVIYNGPGKPLLAIAVHIPSAGSYDWSSFPTAKTTSDTGDWVEPLANGYTPGRAAVGINYSAQSWDDFKNFVAGALFALGGGSILAAVIEAVHTRDWDVIRALRSQ
jgi:hypothetical protein